IVTSVPDAIAGPAMLTCVPLVAPPYSPATVVSHGLVTSVCPKATTSAAKAKFDGTMDTSRMDAITPPGPGVARGTAGKPTPCGSGVQVCPSPAKPSSHTQPVPAAQPAFASHAAQGSSVVLVGVVVVVVVVVGRGWHEPLHAPSSGGSQASSLPGSTMP